MKDLAETPFWVAGLGIGGLICVAVGGVMVTLAISPWLTLTALGAAMVALAWRCTP